MIVVAQPQLMRVVVATADHEYYLWQALVQAYAMDTLGIEMDLLVYHQRGGPSQRLTALREAMPGATVWTWQDPRPARDKVYNPSMKAWLLARYLEARPDAQPFYYLDPDCIFTKAPEEHPAPWHGSDTDWYTGPGYIKSKGEGLWLDLCSLVGVDQERAATYRGIGAQYVIAGTTPRFWDDVARLSLEAYRHMVTTAKKYHPATEQYPVQAWCAEMYVTQLLAIREGLEPPADEAMSFLWANGPASEWDQHMFFHDAGVEKENGRDFCKISHQQSPWGKALEVHPESASARYVDHIRATEEQHPDLIWVE